MGNTVYPECVRELYDSEIFGEAAFLALDAVAKNNTEKYHFGTLLQLETETKARLRPFLYRYDLSLQELDVQSDVAGLVGLYQENSWQDFLGAIRPIVAQFTARFEEIEGAGPETDKSVLQSMVVHESAILKWIDMEIAEQRDGSLDAVIDLLHYPLPQH